MKLKTILIGICTLTLISIPNISAYASSIISSGVSSKYNSYLDYKVYTTDDLKFIYYIKNNKEVVITQVADINSMIIHDAVINIIGTSTSTKPITEIVFPSKINDMPVTTIGNGNMYNSVLSKLNDVKTVIIPNGVTTISDNAFKDCTSIENFSIPDTITYVGENTFANTKWFENQEDGLLYIGKVAYKYIGTAPMGEFILKDDTTSIAKECFYGQPIEKITIPKSVSNIELHAFFNCINLKSVTILNKDIDNIHKSTIGLYSVAENKANIVDDLVIYGYTGSTAEEYANIIKHIHKDANIKFVYLDTPKITGDFNNDEKVSLIDLMLLKRKVLNHIEYLNNGDINNDGNINILDFITLKNQILNNKEDF